YYAVSPGARRASRAFLARALGREPRAGDVYRHLHSFASTLHDRILLAAGRESAFDIAAHGVEDVESLLAQGRGCLLVGSHLGSFEVLRTLGRANRRPVNVLMHEENARKLRAVFSRLAPGLQARVIDAGRADTMLRVKDCLDRGEIVGILGDRPL